MTDMCRPWDVSAPSKYQRRRSAEASFRSSERMQRQAAIMESMAASGAKAMMPYPNPSAPDIRKPPIANQALQQAATTSTSDRRHTFFCLRVSLYMNMATRHRMAASRVTTVT